MPSPAPISPISEGSDNTAVPRTEPSTKSHKFWFILVSIYTCLFLSALELSSLSTALPTITNDLHGSHFTWVGTAYSLAAAVFHPMSGGLAQTYGRRPALLITVGLFALGSGICGGARSMNMLIAGRAVQGLGGGGIQTLTSIILSDLVTLQERGLYVGLYGVVYCIATAVGPITGGCLATGGNWRWLFYLNLPISLIACVSAALFLDLPTPPGSSQKKFMKLDWIGNFLVISSTVACAIGLTRGGITAPWDSAGVLVALILGSAGLVAFIAYEATFATHPLVPFSLMTNVTSVSGYIQSFCCSFITTATVYFFPVYYQACKGSSPIMSGTYFLAFSSLALSALITGLSIRVTKRYRPQAWVGWTTDIVGLGLTSTVHATDRLGKTIAFFVILGLGVGMLSSTPVYPIQAPLSVTQNAPALSLMWFLSSLAAMWGITVGGTVLQNELSKTLPASLIQSVPEGSAIILAVVWRVLTGVGVFGLVASLFMKGLPLHDKLDGEWSMKDGRDQSKR